MSHRASRVATRLLHPVTARIVLTTIACLVTVCPLTGCSGGGDGGGGGDDGGGNGGGNGGGGTPPPATTSDFRDEIVYQLLTDRFANGNPANDSGRLDRRGDAVDPASPVGWHGGDFDGIRRKIEEGYFRSMGFTAIWISPVVLQVPAPGNGGGVNAGKPFVGSTATGPNDSTRSSRTSATSRRSARSAPRPMQPASSSSSTSS
jgi:hypothetical protein